MTNNQLTKEWLQQTIAELESVRDEIPFGIDTNSELELAAFKLALAAMDSEPFGFTDGDRRGMIYKPEHADRLNEPLPVYRHAQPAPVVPLPDVVSVLLNHLEDVLPDDAFNLIDVKAWNAVSMLTCPDACRAAMLQAEPVTTANKLGNSPAIPDTWIPVSERMPEREYVLAADFSGKHYSPCQPNAQVGIHDDWFGDGKPT
ncbi:hypothetical protein [Klebsiella aerogenes]|uniref:hypothetical protein n=1 Tax=Klebsiella aerogenes TaxID=548 RepID=UPI002FFA6565